MYLQKLNKFTLYIRFSLVLFIFITGCSGEYIKTETSNTIKNDHFFQYSEKTKLLTGDYEGALSIADLKSKGNFGIGTINNIDGEMVILDNNYYTIKSSGKVLVIEDSNKTPFANVKFFEADTSFIIKDNIELKKLHSLLNEINYDNLAAVKIAGSFKNVKSRSIDAQDKPYPPLSKVVEEQTIFEFENLTGTIVGFFIPEYLEGLNFPGYHFHFVKKDLSGGGHLLDCITDSVSVELDFTNKLEFDLK